MQYEEARSFLDSLQFFKIKLGLDSMQRFLEDVGHPQKNLKYVHVAGTNGKGSVSVSLLTLFARAGYNVGLYTSPHLSSVRERFRINDAYISKDDFAAMAGRIVNILDNRRITYFEFTTALALLWFAERKVDLVILEVGMGGRLDATNVITPLVSIITNVSMDHEAYLGDTLTAVAYEKAGIIKPGVPVVSGVEGPIPTKVVEERCRELNAPLYLLGRDFIEKKDEEGRMHFEGNASCFRSYDSLTSSLIGEHQRKNTALVLATISLLDRYGFHVTDQTLRSGLNAVRWPGRLELISPESISTRGSLQNDQGGNEKKIRFLLDGAHNPAGVQSLVSALQNDLLYNHLYCIWGAMIDKDILQTLTIIAPLATRIILARPEGERSADPEELLARIPDPEKSKAVCECSVIKAIALAEDLAEEDDLICIAGSLYLVGEARAHLAGELVA